MECNSFINIASDPIVLRIGIVIAFVLLVGCMICKYRAFLWKWVNRIISKSQWWQLLGLSILIVGFLILLVMGSCCLYPLESNSFSDRFWHITGHFLNPGNFGKGGDENASFWVLITGICGMVLLSGLLISVLSNILQRQVERVKHGQVYYKFQDHFVIIGFDKMTISLIKQLAERYPDKEILLQTIQNVPQVYHSLHSNLDTHIEDKITIISGNRTSEEDLEKLYLPWAKEIFVLGENEEYDHDSVNFECLQKAVCILKETVGNDQAYLIEQRNERALEDYNNKYLKKWHVLFEYQSTYAVFQQQQTNDILFLYIDFIPFNFYEMWARKVFVAGRDLNGITYPVLDRIHINPESDPYVHLVIVAATDMGVALAVEAARVSHYTNFRKRKTRITIVDKEAHTQMNIIRSRYAAFMEAVDVYYNNAKTGWSGELSHYMDIEIHFIQGCIEGQDIRTSLVQWANDPQQILTVAICFNNPPASLEAGLYLPDELYLKEIPVLVRMETSGSILQAFQSEGKYKSVYPFGMTNECYELDLNEDLIPLFVQHIYYHPFNYNKKEVYPEELWKVWRTTSVVHKWSNRYSADMIPVKLRAAHIPVNNYELIFRFPDEDWLMFDRLESRLAEIEHNRWNTERLLAGYRYLNDCRKKQLLDKIEDNDLKESILHLYDLKEIYFKKMEDWAGLLLSHNGDEQHEEVIRQKASAEVIWKEKIKPAKSAIEKAGYHDCILPYEKLSANDKFSDRAITQGIKWIVKKLNNKN